MLRSWTDDDLADLLAGVDELVTRFRRSAPVSEPDARVWIATRRAHIESGTALELAIADGTTIVGSIALWEVRRNHQTAMVSYWLAPGGRGRGLATRALRLLAGWAFDELDLKRLALDVEVDNVASRRVAERCGFVREGRMRSAFRQPDGSRGDLHLYGLLPGELRR